MISDRNALVVEDDKDLALLLTIHLEEIGFAVEREADGRRAFKRLSERRYDLVVLDWMLPGIGGLELCQTLRAFRDSSRAQTPILLVTARAERDDVLAGLAAGADDYITKPFDVEIFLARVQAVLRRTPGSAAGAALEDLRHEDLVVDSRNQEIIHSEARQALTPSELRILQALWRSGSVLSRDDLLTHLLEPGVTVTERTIDTHVFGLRRKLGPHAHRLETVRGSGYRLVLDAAPKGHDA